MKFAGSLVLILLCGTLLPAAQKKPAKPETAQAKKIAGSGCVEAGVEAGCLVLKDSHTGALYNLLFSGSPAAINTAIRFQGTAHEGPTTCMQGTAVDIKKWTPIKTKCSSAADKKSK